MVTAVLYIQVDCVDCNTTDLHFPRMSFGFELQCETAPQLGRTLLHISKWEA